MVHSKKYIALDVGEKRIGVAIADASVPIATPLTTIEVDGTEVEKIHQFVESERAGTIVVGYPRNQSGDPTAQTAFVEAFVEKLGNATPIVFQDESLTSVLAEQQLASHGKPYSKGDIDAHAAALILQDYLELHHAS